jgi:hypothetical protein
MKHDENSRGGVTSEPWCTVLRSDTRPTLRNTSHTPTLWSILPGTGWLVTTSPRSSVCWAQPRKFGKDRLSIQHQRSMREEHGLTFVSSMVLASRIKEDQE